MPEAKMRLRDVASEIDGYLKHFEADAKINSYRNPKRTLKPFYNAGAGQTGRYIWVRYVSFQGITYLARDEAERYLGFLRGGGIGKHFLCEGEICQKKK